MLRPRTRSRGLIGVNHRNFDVKIFQTANQAAEYAREYGTRCDGALLTVSTNIKRKSYDHGMAYGIRWINITGNMKDDQVQKLARLKKSVTSIEIILDRFYKEVEDEECLSVLESMLNTLADFTERKVNQGMLRDADQEGKVL